MGDFIQSIGLMFSSDVEVANQAFFSVYAPVASALFAIILAGSALIIGRNGFEWLDKNFGWVALAAILAFVWPALIFLAVNAAALVGALAPFWWIGRFARNSENVND
tara:strand:- start:2897 stop:3217 length:321 start_codon:yes stop_codon:yes gene_type:complete